MALELTKKTMKHHLFLMALKEACDSGKPFSREQLAREHRMVACSGPVLTGVSNPSFKLIETPEANVHKWVGPPKMVIGVTYTFMQEIGNYTVNLQGKKDKVETFNNAVIELENHLKHKCVSEALKLMIDKGTIRI